MVKPRKTPIYNRQFDLETWLFFPSVYGLNMGDKWELDRRCLRRVIFQIWVISESSTAVAFVYHQNGEYLANSEDAPGSAHKFYSINIFIDDSTSEILLNRSWIRYHICENEF